MKFITLNPPSNEKEQGIWDFIKLAESKINDQEPRSNQASYVRGMKAIFNLFTHDHFMDVPKEKIKTALAHPDPGAEIMERMKKLEAVAEAARDYREHEYLASTDKWHEVIDRLDKSLDALEAVTPCT